MTLLQSSRGFCNKPHLREKWNGDLAEIAELKVSDIQAFQADIPAASSGNLTALMALARDKGHTPVFKALKHIQMITANVPLTDGHKSTLRQSGHAMNLNRGPMHGFYTTNFADTWSPILAVLADGPGEPLGQRTRSLRRDAPEMPTLRDMHRIAARRPMLQAWHYLLHDAAMHTEVLCVRNAYLGKHRYDLHHELVKLPDPEDDLASTGEAGIYNFVQELLKAQESQGRGYTHGHEKVASVIDAMGVDRLCALLDPALPADRVDELIDEFCRTSREQGLEACATLQYDSSSLPAAQLGVDVGPEPFTLAQQKDSRYDGGTELDGTQRECIDVVPRAEPWHVGRDLRLAEIEGRPPLHPFKNLSLQGAAQSILPSYRDPAAFRRQRPIGPDGLPDDCFDGGAAEHDSDRTTIGPPLYAAYVTDENEQVIGFRGPDGSIADEDAIAADASEFEQSYGHHVFALQNENHNRGCTSTCFKKKKPVKKKVTKVERCRSTSAAW